MANEYEEHLLEGELNPQFIKEVEEAKKEKSITFSSIDELDSLVEKYKNDNLYFLQILFYV